jgi:hypothetical protein
MTAAVITATTVAKFDSPTSIVSGTDRKFKTLYLEGVKAAANDWFLSTTYLSTAESTQIVGWRALTESSGNAYAIDVVTYDSDDAKIDLTSANTGTAHIFIDYYE